MKHHTLFWTTTMLAALLGGCPTSSEPIAINEFVASNTAGLVDDSGGTPDWIELFNTSSEEVSLDGWFISDDPDTPQRYALDGLAVPGNGYLLLFASGDTTVSPAHLPFKLSAGGEEILLNGPDGPVDAIAYGNQAADTSTARVPDGTGEWKEATPSPGEANE